ncbi:hypothetical protein THRCLA_21799 [Thraustotheca clavata]|uniref:glutathione gamma-glutamylcysteinyltransferase n=1 Tax=Thraustotheca clavata TaxID=74557 RepID=A0A1V9ZNU8_9STRA|nr:hypothetical protein THRCLA_21799 [Thraustotheca clavata]
MVALCYTEPLHPAPRSAFDRIRRALLVTVLSILIPPYLAYAYLFQRSFIDPIMSAAKRESIKLDPKYKNPDLLKRIWSTKVGKIYLESDLEYQCQEGYCSSATMRNILKSIGISSLPPPRSGASTPLKYAQAIDKASNGQTTSSIVYGSEGYEAFMCTVKKANDPNYRVAVNFLRSPLFGITQPSYLPINFVLALFGGHFSVIVGYLEDEDLVAVFDVNHTYGPYLVDSKRLYDAVNSYDKMANNTRALIVSQVNISN